MVKIIKIPEEIKNEYKREEIPSKLEGFLEAIKKTALMNRLWRVSKLVDDALDVYKAKIIIQYLPNWKELNEQEKEVVSVIVAQARQICKLLREYKLI